jgi:carbamoyltransferase
MKHRTTIGIYGIQDMTVAGVPTISHDHGLAVMEHGKLINYVHLERLDRLKHSNQLPQLLYSLLKEKKLLRAEPDLVFVDNMLGRAFINQSGNIRFEAGWPEKLLPTVENGYCWWLDKVREASVLNHELAHLGSCLPFFGNFKPNSLLVHFDGGASRSNFSAWFFDGRKLSCIEHHWNLKWVSAFIMPMHWYLVF